MFQKYATENGYKRTDYWVDSLIRFNHQFVIQDTLLRECSIRISKMEKGHWILLGIPTIKHPKKRKISSTLCFVLSY